jgi:hypothetical protein
MSVSGLYDSIIGDKLARKTLAPYRKIDNSDIDDETPCARKSNRGRKCTCGKALAHPYILRGSSFVCRLCAIEIPRLPSGHPATNKCAGCKTTLPRRSLFQRHGKLYCKQCEKGI